MTDLASGLEEQDEPIDSYAARCVCGWTGPSRSSEREARRDPYASDSGEDIDRPRIR